MAIDTKILCLGVLSEGDRTGYDIKRYVERAFGHFFCAGYGSIYPALAELARDGSVTVREVERTGGRDKKIYAITARGLETLTQALTSTEPRHKVRSEFMAILFFAHLASEERIADVVDAMCRQWREGLLADMAALEKDADRPLRPGQQFCVGLARAVLGAALTYCEEHGPQLARRAGSEDAAPPPSAERAERAPPIGE